MEGNEVKSSKRVRIPNYEVSGEFINSVENGGWEHVMDAINSSNELMNATLKMDACKVAEILERVHADSTSILEYNDENSLSCVISLAYYAARKDYVIYRELPTALCTQDDPV